LREPFSHGIGHFHAAALLTGRAGEFEVEIFASPDMAEFELTLGRENRLEISSTKVRENLCWQVVTDG
jgi:hypothetical protein